MSVRRSILILVIGVALGGVAVGATYGTSDGLVMAAVMAAGGAPILVLSHLFAARRDRLGSLSRQFVIGTGVAVGSVLLMIGVIAASMFVSAHDVFVLALGLGFTGVVAAYSSLILAHGVMNDIDAVRSGVMAVGDGARDVHIETVGRDEIADLAHASNQMIDQLKRDEQQCETAWSAHRDLIAAVSHDLRTPLTSLQLVAEAIKDGVVDNGTRDRYLAQLPVHIQALGGLIDDLFELSRLQAGDVQWSLEKVRLDELLQETVEAMRGQADARGVMVETRVSDDLPLARANPEKLQRVLFNLIQNAIRHTPEDGTVTVCAETSDECVEIEVIDTGEGIDSADQERVFQPFFKSGEEAARTRPGAGLGLTICRAIVEAHGGRIWLGERDGGARVRFSLPRAPA